MELDSNTLKYLIFILIIQMAHNKISLGQSPCISILQLRERMTASKFVKLFQGNATYYHGLTGISSMFPGIVLCSVNCRRVYYQGQKLRRKQSQTHAFNHAIFYCNQKVKVFHLHPEAQPGVTTSISGGRKYVRILSTKQQFEPARNVEMLKQAFGM